MTRQKTCTTLFAGTLLALGTATLTLSGCNSHEGGGWIESIVPGFKATFGFELICDPDTHEISGELQYVDHGIELKAHCVPDSVDFGLCSDAFTTAGEFFGSYTPQPRNLGPGGDFFVRVTDGGEPGGGADTFEIRFFGGVFDGYRNAGRIEGGNIQEIEE